ncbi:MAG: hypothetical protein JSV97_03590 [candidate division WOR-3 bacterium]|nr:MAG: hypothetical protein JSV97_03590 [candidate division WOR-3 bacterium]
MAIIGWQGIPIVLILCINATNNEIPIEISGNTIFSSHYLIADIDKIRAKSELEQVIEHILTKYTEAGFPFCRISPTIVEQDSNIEKIILEIREGERVVIADYVFTINGKTDIAALRKILHIRKENFFSSKEITRLQKKMLKTGVFEDIDHTIVYRKENYYLSFTLTERQSDYVTALGSFAEDDYNFGVTFYSLNLLGTLRRLQFSYEYQKLFSLHFTEPILISPAAFTVNFALWTYDSLRLTELNGIINAPFGDYFTISLMTGIEVVSRSDNESGGRHATNNMLGLGMGVDYRTRAFLILQEVNFEYLFRQFDRLNIKYDGEFGFGPVTVKPHYHWVKTDSLEFFDYLRIGGAKSIRGYLEEEFVVSKALWLNLEYKKFFVFPLFDIAVLDNDFKFSYGLGMEAKSKFANATLVIAFPQGGTWQDGKIHVTFERGF